MPRVVCGRICAFNQLPNSRIIKAIVLLVFCYYNLYLRFPRSLKQSSMGKISFQGVEL